MKGMKIKIERDMDEEDSAFRKRLRRNFFREFDCPACEANNPYDQGFRIGEEVSCAFCGVSFLVHLRGEEELLFKEL